MRGQTLKILVVEDEFMIANTLAECLRSHGHDCIGPAANLSSALALAEAEAQQTLALAHQAASAIRESALEEAAAAKQQALDAGAATDLGVVKQFECPAIPVPASG